MKGLILHCGANAANREDVYSAKPPAETKSWKPVAYKDVLDHVFGRLHALDLPVKDEGYGLSKDGKRMFGVINAEIEAEDDTMGLAIGIRQSYDKSVSLGICVGATVFVCDNLSFSGSAFSVTKRNTAHVWKGVVSLADTALFSAVGHFKMLKRDAQKMKDKPVHLDRGYEILGRALGHDVLKPQQATVAFKEWVEPTHEAFQPRNLWSLYNAMTEALKRGRVVDVIPRHTKAHAFAMAEA